jgi:hypothetical protein
MADRPTSAAGQIWPHLPHDDARVAKPSKRSVADSIWPGLAQEAWQVRARAEQKAEAKRMADHLQATIDAIRAEKRGR